MDVFKKPKGSLAEVPFAALLVGVAMKGRTCALSVSRHSVEKRILFEEGAPVDCTSNLLHETVGKFLQSRDMLTEKEYQRALSESVASDTPIETWLVQNQLVQPYALFRQLQVRLATSILDCFRWTDGEYDLTVAAELTRAPARVNTPRLILKGVGAMPADFVTRHFPFADDEPLLLTPDPFVQIEDLRLRAQEARIVNRLREPNTFSDLVTDENDADSVRRALYALHLLDVVSDAESASKREAPQAAESPEVSGDVRSVEEGDRVAMLDCYMQHRSQDPFELLGLAADATDVQIRDAFLELVNRFSPLRFEGEDRSKAQELLLSWAWAYAALTDHELRSKWDRRHEVRQEGPPKKAPSEFFKISTELLDASAQFDQGRKRALSGDVAGAIPYLEYAVDLEPTPSHRAWLAWVKFLDEPELRAGDSLGALLRIVEETPQCDIAHYFAGRIEQRLGDRKAATQHFARATQLRPDVVQYRQALTDAGG